MTEYRIAFDYPHLPEAVTKGKTQEEIEEITGCIQLHMLKEIDNAQRTPR